MHNGLIDKRPALIARCRGVADIVDALKAARDRGLEVAVRGGGHNVAGRSTTDGGLMVDLSLMKGIHVDPRARTARARGRRHLERVQPRDPAPRPGHHRRRGLLDRRRGPDARRRARLAHGQARARPRQPPLGGGRAGRRQGRHGERRRSTRTCSGRCAAAAATSAWWRPSSTACTRSGPMVTGGLIAYPFSAAWDVLRHFRDVTASLPDEFTVFAGLVHAPDGSGEKLAALVLCHCGTLADGRGRGRGRSSGSARRRWTRSGRCRTPRSTRCWTRPTRPARSTTGSRASCPASATTRSGP